MQSLTAGYQLGALPQSGHNKQLSLPLPFTYHYHDDYYYYYLSSFFTRLSHSLDIVRLRTLSPHLLLQGQDR